MLIKEEGIVFSPHILHLLEQLRLILWRYGKILVAGYVVVIGTLIFLEGRNPDRTILWLVVLALLPGLGLILYLMLGPDLSRIRNRRAFQKKRTKDVSPAKVGEKGNLLGDEKLVTLLQNSAGARLLKRNSFELLVNGEAKFPRLWEELCKAEHYIHAEYFIIKDDTIGRQFADILCEKAEQGILVRLLYDDVGCWKLGRAYVNRLKKAGVDVRVSFPVAFPSFRSHLNFRNHRKIVVIDGEVAFSGGLNVGEEYCGEGPLGWWRDTHALYSGQSVAAFQKIFIDDWNVCKGDKIGESDFYYRALRSGERVPLKPLPLQVVASDSASAWHSIKEGYVSMIASARERIWITTPYLVPDNSVLSALRLAALSGVDVRLLLPSVPDHKLVFWAGRSNVEDLLRAGVRIWMYQNGFVHAKTLLMDGSVASVGTANVDTRSLEINSEVQVFIYDGEINSQLAALFLRDCERAQECLLSEWVHRPLWHRIFESGGKLWSAQV